MLLLHGRPSRFVIYLPCALLLPKLCKETELHFFFLARWNSCQLWRLSMNEFQFRCFNGQFLTSSDGDVISATADSSGDPETFYIERNNTLLHIKLLNGSYLQVLFLLCSEMEAVTPCHYIHCDETRTNSLNFRNNV
jgi:hypothetical protein